jgi:Tfp pilus assembly protein PilV
MRATSTTKRAGFNLVETLVASMILSGAVLTLGAISTNALRDTRLNRHYGQAAGLLDKQLNMIDYMGIDQFVKMGQTEGVFEDVEPGYQWEATTQYQNTDNLYLVTIKISWMEGKRPYSVTAQTMLDGAGLAATSETVEQQ